VKPNFKIIKAKRILLSPLNWGIGHAARLVPIANYLHQQGAEVFICASGAALNLLQLECTYATFVKDIPFEITYGKSYYSQILKLTLQLPKMFAQVYREHQLLKKLVVKYNIEFVISDNRYGFYHFNIPCVFITHQINIKVPFGASLVNLLNHYFIKKFDACWVPDFEQANQSLAGELSSNHQLQNVNYIGTLSRGSKANTVTDKNAPILYLLSGVEPQRSLFEKIILQYHSQHPHKAILIRGSTTCKEIIQPKHNLVVYNVCDAKQLQSIVSECRYVVCRSGYSSIMDLVHWQKNAVLVPTPGQNEQEYLAHYLSQKQWFYCINQNNFLQFNEAVIEKFECPEKIKHTVNFEALINRFF
jgi:uncharacterized protein (TIGR00661 family)